MALEFDGSSQYINFGAVLDSVFAGADKKFSISLWLQLNDITSADKWLIGKYDRNSNKRSWFFYIGATDTFGDTLVFLWALGNASASRIVKASTAINSTSNIYHIVLTYDGSIDTNDGLDRPDFYINGVKESKSLRTSSGVLPNIPTTTGLLSIGAELDASGNPHSSVPKYLPAKAWDVRIYDRNLPPNEIAEIYHKRGADRVWQGLVGWWRLDEFVTGASVRDLSGNGNHGTPYNSPVYQASPHRLRRGVLVS